MFSSGEGGAPLSGLRILDLTRLAPGPFATTLLGDLGAEVITVEPPGARRAGADVGVLPGHGGPASRAAGTNPLYRSRRSIVLDLKSEADRDLALRLVAQSDVFMEGFRPGVAARLGLGYDALARLRPDLVYCSISGYGQEGPMALAPGHDLNYLAESGVLSLSTRDGGRPAWPLNLLADLAGGGMVAAIGILAAVRRRDLSGEGALVDVSMYESLLAMASVAESWRRAGAPDPSWGRGLVSGAAPFYDCYRTADDRWIAVGAMEPKFYAALCEGIGRPELTSEQLDTAAWPRLRAAFEETFATRTLEQWIEHLDLRATAVSPVRSLEEAFAAAQRDGFADGEGRVRAIPRISGEVAAPERLRTAREAGQDRDEILSLLARLEAN